MKVFDEFANVMKGLSTPFCEQEKSICVEIRGKLNGTEDISIGIRKVHADTLLWVKIGAVHLIA